MTNREHIINFCGAARALASQTRVMTDQELADIYAMTSVFTRLLEDTRKELVARCKAHGNAGGYILRPVQGNREIRDLRAAYMALKDIIPKEEFLKACSVSITKLEGIFATVKRQSGVFFKDSQAVKNAFNNALGPALESRPEHLALTRAPMAPPQMPPPPILPSDDDIL